MLEQWLVLSDRSAEVAPKEKPASTLIETGLFAVELALPLTEAAVLLDFHSAEGWPRTFTLFHDPQAGLVLIHRQGQNVARHALPGPVAQASGTGRLSLRFDAPGRVWQMQLEYLGQDSMTTAMAEGRDPLPVMTGDLHALSEGPFRNRRHSSVLWFGLTKGAALPQRAPWIGQRTPIETPRGPVMAGHLSSGDLVCTADGGLLALRGISRLDLPARGSFSPVILRAPFFGASHDLLIASDQLVALSGLEVEYLFNEEEVLVHAGDLVDGRSALAEQRRAVASVLMLEFDFPALLVADGCTLLSGQQRQPAPRRVLQSYETLTLMALLGRSGHRRVA